jgi:hypothetical protein
MTTRIFAFEDQRGFAALSGDANPLHMDALYARRLLYGRAVVHGIHLLFWALDHACREPRQPFALTRLICRFSGPVAVDEPATLAVDWNQDRLACRIATAQGDVAVIDARVRTDAAFGALKVREGCPPIQQPTALARETVSGASGMLDLYFDANLFSAMFPRAAECFSHEQASILLSTTRLVGVHCPGLNSIFSELAIDFDQAGPAAVGETGALAYRVAQYDARINLVRMQIEAPRARGVIKAFLRPAPITQPTAVALQAHVEPAEFVGRRALVVGGSRGLGALSAKLLAAGGAAVTLTYLQGEGEALEVEKEIAAIGAAARTIRLDVRASEEELKSLVADLAPVSHLYYFATAPIFVAQRGQFNPDLFRRFCAVYVEGFAAIVRVLLPLGLRVVLYPSSAAVAEVPIDMGEYAAAKAAGEQACMFFEKANPGLTILAPRLPRLPTDQTRSLLPTREEDPVAHLLLALRQA